jgi:glycyl-tRNA synthetase
VEPAVGVNRLLLAFLCEGLREEHVAPAAGSSGGADEESGGSGAPAAQTRLVLRLHDRLAPFKAAVLPLVRKDALTQPARALHARLLAHVPVEYDDTQSVGKRYRRQDEIGTPLCITVDSQSAADGTVTLRCRDSMAQVRLHADELVARCARNEFSRAALEGAFAHAAAEGARHAAARA